MKTMADRVAYARTMLEEGRIIRKKWRDRGEDGRERLCLLLSLAPEHKDGMQRTGLCAGSLCVPNWFASMVITMDDYGTEEAWRPMVERLFALALRWHVLTEPDWVHAYRRREALFASIVDEGGPWTLSRYDILADALLSDLEERCSEREAP